MQLSYSQNMKPAIAGTFYDISFRRVDSFAVEGASGIGLGCGVVAGTDAAVQVKLPAGAVTGFKGVALLQAKEQDASGNVVYIEKDTVPVADLGRVWVPVIGPVSVDGAAYLFHTGANAGKWTGSSGANQGAITGAKFKTATSGDGIAVLELR